MERESRKPLSNNTKPILTKSVQFFCLGRIQMEYVKGVKTSSLSEKMDFHARTLMHICIRPLINTEQWPLLTVVMLSDEMTFT